VQLFNEHGMNHSSTMSVPSSSEMCMNRRTPLYLGRAGIEPPHITASRRRTHREHREQYRRVRIFSSQAQDAASSLIASWSGVKVRSDPAIGIGANSGGFRNRPALEHFSCARWILERRHAVATDARKCPGAPNLRLAYGNTGIVDQHLGEGVVALQPKAIIAALQSAHALEAPDAGSATMPANDSSADEIVVALLEFRVHVVDALLIAVQRGHRRLLGVIDARGSCSAPGGLIASRCPSGRRSNRDASRSSHTTSRAVDGDHALYNSGATVSNELNGSLPHQIFHTFVGADQHARCCSNRRERAHSARV